MDAPTPVPAQAGRGLRGAGHSGIIQPLPIRQHKHELMNSEERNKLQSYEKAVEVARLRGDVAMVQYSNHGGYGARLFWGKMVFSKDTEGKSCLQFQGKGGCAQFDPKGTEILANMALISFGAEYPECLTEHQPIARYELGTYDQMIAKAEGEATEGYDIEVEEMGSDYVEARITNYLHGHPDEREVWSFGFSVFRCRPENWNGDTFDTKAETISTGRGSFPPEGARVMSASILLTDGTHIVFGRQHTEEYDPCQRMCAFIEENQDNRTIGNNGTSPFASAVYDLEVNVEGTIDKTRYSGPSVLDWLLDSVMNLPYVDEEETAAPVPAFISGIDWKMLKNQKLGLLNEIILLEERDIDSSESVNSLTGIVHLLDALQDYAEAAGLPVSFAEEE